MPNNYISPELLSLKPVFLCRYSFLDSYWKCLANNQDPYNDSNMDCSKYIEMKPIKFLDKREDSVSNKSPSENEIETI